MLGITRATESVRVRFVVPDHGEHVLSEVKARYLVGLTATPQRRDGRHPITEKTSRGQGGNYSDTGGTGPGTFTSRTISPVRASMDWSVNTQCRKLSTRIAAGSARGRTFFYRVPLAQSTL
jgi:hypothetical protein